MEKMRAIISKRLPKTKVMNIMIYLLGRMHPRGARLGLVLERLSDCTIGDVSSFTQKKSVKIMPKS